MVVIKVIVESSHSGSAGGFSQLSIDDEKPTSELIKMFCSSKNIPMEPTYAIVNHANVVFEGRKPISFYDVRNNEHLYLGSSTDEGKTYNFGSWFKLAALAHFIGLVGLIVCIIIYLKDRDIPDSYSIVLDAGSTHTDIIAYSWPGSKINCTGQVKQLQSCTIDGGIAYVDPKNVSQYLDDCFETSVSMIPKSLRKDSQIFFGATAGLRVLNESNPKIVQELMEELRKYFKKSNMGYKDENVEIITGTVEGVSGWITTNYLKDTLYPQGDARQSWGSLDLGGASTQIAFQVNETTKNGIDNSMVVPINLFGYEHNVYSQSFLCYGVVQAMKRYRAKVVLDFKEHTSIIPSPCEPKDYNITVPASDLFGTLCFPYNSSSVRYNTYTFMGSGDYDKCRRHMTDILSTQFCDKYGLKENCIDLSRLSGSFVGQPFIAHSAFGYIVEDLNLLPNSSQPEYVKKTKQYCNYSFAVLEEINQPKLLKEVPIRVQETLCFNAVYAFTLLTDVYNFTENAWSNIWFQNEIDGSSLGWSLGYMVNATESISSGNPVPKLNVLAFAFLMVLFAIFVLVSIGLIVHAIRIRKSASYERTVLNLMDEELTKFLLLETPNHRQQ